ncbi:MULTISPECIES: hypothetical protein [unclassified Micromonospora]|uniref:hypothetical protein n=1 Tax=unclassified Micromonospora TaxID=2617518 RepID=UPI0033275CA4
MTAEDWVLITSLVNPTQLPTTRVREEPADMDPITEEAWWSIQDAEPFAPGLVREVRMTFGNDPDYILKGQTWIVRVKYDAIPERRYNEPDGPMPSERSGRLISAEMHDNETELTVELVADNKPMAEEIALRVVKWWAEIYRLPEPRRVHVMDN